MALVVFSQLSNSFVDSASLVDVNMAAASLATSSEWEIAPKVELRQVANWSSVLDINESRTDTWAPLCTAMLESSDYKIIA